MVLGSHRKSFGRCVSSKELGTIGLPSGSPYAVMMSKREEIESTMRDRLTTLRQSESYQRIGTRSSEADGTSLDSSSVSVQELSNRKRNQRRAEHAQAVIDDLCEVVTDLFVAESKLLNPSKYGVSETATSRDPVLNNVRMFVSSLPIRYALGVDTPSEVLLHMRLMAAARSNRGQVAVHIHSIEPDSMPAIQTKANNNAKSRLLHLVTISCRDVNGLLEYISGLLATGGSRVIDADVMLSNDNVVLDRFIVDMAGRLRLDMLSNSVEAFLADRSAAQDLANHQTSCSSSPKDSSGAAGNQARVASGPIYHKLVESPPSDEQLRRELQSGVPLTAMLASNSRVNLASISLPLIHKRHSLPIDLPARKDRRVPEVTLSMKRGHDIQEIVIDGHPPDEEYESHRRKLVDRPRSHDLDKGEEFSLGSSKTLEYVTAPAVDRGGGVPVQTKRSVHLIPFDELMLIETIGTGRVSTIYRAAWQRQGQSIFSQDMVKMVALKVAMKNPENGDMSHIDELRQEADIAARFQHACICDLVGVAADADCFCLAYEYCQGGSLLSLLTDTSRYYEYLPIALDIANGMAYLHSRNVIHRDLKPSNILLTKHHRAKIADFGMSVNNHGQELTAETGTYRYMAPYVDTFLILLSYNCLTIFSYLRCFYSEVIRHESYSSNADVYSFGICLWQLITREIPYATMTPIQAAYTVAQGQRPEIPASTPMRLQEIIRACWDQDSHRRPSFTYIALALADYAKLAFSPANVGTQTLKIANEMLATVEGNSTINVDFSAPVNNDFMNRSDSFNNIGLEIE
jgi:serine/threonine protein kinase